MKRDVRIRVLTTAYHRNGIGGAPFHVVVFRDRGEDGSVKVGIVFEDADHVAVLDIALLSKHDIAFGSNSWRGDCYEPALRPTPGGATATSPRCGGP